MFEHNELILEMVELGQEVNPACPFVSCITDEWGQLLVTAVSSKHISPLYTSEQLALHLLARNYSCKPNQPLTLYSTAEITPAGVEALIHMNLYAGIQITRHVYGASREDVSRLWSPCSSITCTDMYEAFRGERPVIEFIGGVEKDACDAMFEEAGILFRDGTGPVLSSDLEEFCSIEDWMLESCYEDVCE
ncbi:hypothetical protein M3P05_03080 [Sansalvadorimonas sp. 2012CJ34-2]|uniref:Uncharacterized protein n=1 Tax=Parendozoicomonas callyspongiae TaxID=2942213 RepID=A0ABT0PC28_9GAMM|nr:hypothetical protein [Sansalvadorimonas sp. 2012CJ34-2]MCL6268935.1 hypothetical protein [Sansalvadorimonas sp. 2012CJ34-2]